MELILEWIRTQALGTSAPNLVIMHTQHIADSVSPLFLSHPQGSCQPLSVCLFTCDTHHCGAPHSWPAALSPSCLPTPHDMLCSVGVSSTLVWRTSHVSPKHSPPPGCQCPQADTPSALGLFATQAWGKHPASASF